MSKSIAQEFFAAMGITKENWRKYRKRVKVNNGKRA